MERAVFLLIIIGLHINLISILVGGMIIKALSEATIRYNTAFYRKRIIEVNNMQGMQILVLVLSRYEKLDALLVELKDAGITGATVINSTGMAQVINRESDHLLGSLRTYLTPQREDNRTVFIVLNQEKVETAKSVIHKVIGSLSEPGTGILFLAPTLYVEGIPTEQE